jgi:hypothetical protein
MMDSYTDRHNRLPVLGSHPIQWTANTRRPSMEEMRVDHGCLDVAMAQLLDHAVNGVTDAAHSRPEPAASSSTEMHALPRVERMGTEVIDLTMIVAVCHLRRCAPTRGRA